VKLDLEKISILSNKLREDEINYIGRVFGSKTVISFDGKYKINGNTKKIWKYRCECGYEDSVLEYTLTHNIRNHCRKCMHGKMRIPKAMDCVDYYELKTVCGYAYYIDKEDYEKIIKYTWHKHKDGYLRTRYDIVDGKNKYILLHNFLLGRFDASKDDADHINRLPYDNRKSNLRVVSHNENMQNISKKSNSKHEIMGIHYSKKEDRWKAYITHNKKQIKLGTFKNKQDAIISRLSKEYEIYKENAYQMEAIIKYKIPERSANEI